MAVIMRYYMQSLPRQTGKARLILSVTKMSKELSFLAIYDLRRYSQRQLETNALKALFRGTLCQKR